MGFFNNIKILFGSLGKNTPAPQSPADATTTAQKKVLIVEDEKLLAEALEVKFRHAGFLVFRAENGKIGLDMVVSHRPNIVLTDILMPVMDGKVMIRKIREMPQFKMLPVLVLTNAGDVDSMKEMERYYNASGFLIKANVSPEEIVQRVKEIVQ